MPPKCILQAEEQLRLRADLQAATLAALMASRRWEPGDLAFRGGTCLNLAYGSARFSEDLDFMIRGGLSLDGLAGEIKRRIRLPPDTPADLAISITAVRDDKNPHAFTVTLAGPQVVGSAKVKVELYQTESALMDSLQIMVSTITTPSGLQTFVPSATLDEILADKVYALGPRERLKPRDVFDLWWLMQRSPQPALDPDKLTARLSIYPRGDGTACATAGLWLKDAQSRLRTFSAHATVKVVQADLQRWLPSSWPMNEDEASRMLAAAALQLEAGIGIIQDFEAGCTAAA
jgi:hypothetical protein